MPVLVGLDDDVLLGTRFERQPHRENHVAAVEVLLLLEGELEFGAFLENLARENRFERGDERLCGILGHAAGDQFIDESLALGQPDRVRRPARAAASS